MYGVSNTILTLSRSNSAAQHFNSISRRDRLLSSDIMIILPLGLPPPKVRNRIDVGVETVSMLG